MVKTKKTRVSNSKPFIGKPSPGEKCPGIEPDFLFYEVEDKNKFDSGDEAVIHVKTDKYSMANKKNTKKTTLPVIK